MKLSKLVTFINDTIDFSEDLDKSILLLMRFLHEEMQLISIHLHQIEEGKVTKNINFPDDVNFHPFPSHLLGGPFKKYVYHVNTIEDQYVYNISLNKFGLFTFISENKFGEEFLDEFTNYITLVDYIFFSFKKEHELEGILENERNLFQNIIDAIPDLIAYKGVDEKYYVINKAAKEHYKSDIIGKTVDELYPSKEANFVRELDQEVYKTLNPKRRTIPVYTSFGFFQADSIRSPVLDTAGNLEGIVSIARDISDVMKAKEKLESNYEFQNILVRLATKFINVPYKNKESAVNEILSMSGQFINADRAFVFLYHFDKELIEYRYEWCKSGVLPQINEIKYLDQQDYIEDWVNKHKAGESIFIPDIEALDHSSMIYKTLSMQDIKSVITIPLMDGDKCLGFVGFDDVQDNRIWDQRERNLLNILAEIIANLLINTRKEKELINAKEMAEAASSEKSSFLANVSHDIRTPLTGLFNVIELLRLSSHNDEQNQWLDIADYSIKSLDILLSNVIDITKIESGIFDFSPKEFNLEHLAFNALNTQASNAIEKNIDLKFNYDYSIDSTLYYDTTMINKILLNLVNNAIKYTDEGNIELSIKKLSQDDKYAKINFQIIDTGIGISETHIKKITNKFYQVNNTIRKEHSTGLGLSITNLLLKQLNSKLLINSTLEKGSEFSFTLNIPLTNRTNIYSVMKNINVAVMVFEFHYPLDLKEALDSLPINVDIFNQATEALKSYDVVIWLLDKHLSETFKAYQTFKATKQSNIMDVIYDINDTINNVDNIKLESYYFAKPPFLRYRFLQRWKDFNNALSLKLDTSNKHTKKRILLIEDNHISLMTLTNILKRNQYIVKECSNAEEGLQALKENAYDILLLDLQLPLMQGDELTEIIRNTPSAFQDIVIIGTTAHALKNDIDQYLKSGMNAVLTKPFNIKLLIEKIETLSKPVQSKNSPILLDRFDETDFESRFEGYLDLGHSMMYEFIKTYNDELNKLDDLFIKNNKDLLRKGLHHYKGMLSYLSAHHLGGIIDELRDKLDTEPFTDLNLYEYYETIHKETLRLVDVLNHYLKHHKENRL